MSVIYRVGAVVAVILLLPGNLHAYIDPGSGSMLLQAVVGGLLAGAAVVRLYWTRVRSWINRKD